MPHNLLNLEQQFKMINKYMRKIASELKIRFDLTFYAARYSFAATLKRQERGIGEIQKFLGMLVLKLLSAILRALVMTTGIQL